MPKNKFKDIKNPPEIYKLSYRKKMGANAATEKLTNEESLNLKFPDKKIAINWIEQNGDHSNVYIIRNRSDEMLESWCWKKESKKWGTINRAGYFGGYKIGNPNIMQSCGCCIDLSVANCKHMS